MSFWHDRPVSVLVDCAQSDLPRWTRLAGSREPVDLGGTRFVVTAIEDKGGRYQVLLTQVQPTPEEVDMAGYEHPDEKGRPDEAPKDTVPQQAVRAAVDALGRVVSDPQARPRDRVAAAALILGGSLLDRWRGQRG